MNSQEPNDDSNSHSWASKWNIEPHGYSKNLDNRFFDDDSPHESPVLDVEVKLAADVEFSDDEELVQEVAEYWFPEEADRYEEVAKVVFNDLSVWYMPLASWENDDANLRISLIDSFFPDILQWKAIVRGDDPEEAVEEWESRFTIDDEGWEEDLTDTGMTEEQRVWFNNNAPWLEHISRERDSKVADMELDLGDDDWTDDW